MGKVRYLILLMVSALALVGCDKGSDSKSVNRRGRTGNLTGQAQDVYNGVAGSCSGTTGDYSGTIYVEQDSNGNFRTVVRGFLTGLANPDGTASDELNFGDLDGMCGSNTGFFFDGQVETDEGFSVSELNNSNITRNSSVRMSIIDTTSLRYDLGGIEINANEGSSGYVEDDYVYATFYWSGGKVIFEGWIDYQRKIVSGYADFKNDYHWAGDTPGQGSFGMFEVPLCEFFKCTN